MSLFCNGCYFNSREPIISSAGFSFVSKSRSSVGVNRNLSFEERAGMSVKLSCKRGIEESGNGGLENSGFGGLGVSRVRELATSGSPGGATGWTSIKWRGVSNRVEQSRSSLSEIWLLLSAGCSSVSIHLLSTVEEL